MTIERNTIRWNGWGWAAHKDALAARDDVWDWLAGELGMPSLLATPARPLEEITLAPSRLSPAERTVLVAIVGADRVRDDTYERAFHALGRSYHDLLRLRAGDLTIAPDAVRLSARRRRDPRHSCVGRARRASRSYPIGGGTSVVGGVSAATRSVQGRHHARSVRHGSRGRDRSRLRLRPRRKRASMASRSRKRCMRKASRSDTIRNPSNSRHWAAGSRIAVRARNRSATARRKTGLSPPSLRRRAACSRQSLFRHRPRVRVSPISSQAPKDSSASSPKRRCACDPCRRKATIAAICFAISRAARPRSAKPCRRKSRPRCCACRMRRRHASIAPSAPSGKSRASKAASSRPISTIASSMRRPAR